MKTRNQIYKGEGARLLRIITTYHALRYEQVLQLFPKKEDSTKSLITSLVKQHRLYHDKESGLLCDNPEAAVSPDYGMIAAFWVLLDFKKAIIYHTAGEFPVKLHFFSNDETYEVIYVGTGQEALINHIFENLKEQDTNRLLVLESEDQAKELTVGEVLAYCVVKPDGAVSYYKKKEVP